MLPAAEDLAIVITLAKLVPNGDGRTEGLIVDHRSDDTAGEVVNICLRDKINVQLSVILSNDRTEIGVEAPTGVLVQTSFYDGFFKLCLCRSHSCFHYRCHSILWADMSNYYDRLPSDCNGDML